MIVWYIMSALLLGEDKSVKKNVFTLFLFLFFLAVVSVNSKFSVPNFHFWASIRNCNRWFDLIISRRERKKEKEGM